MVFRKTKVFLKYHHVEQLTELLDTLGKKVVVLQKGSWSLL